MPTAPPANALLQQFRQAFADVNLSSSEARHLRDQLTGFQRQHGNVEALRHQLFELAKEHFNTFKDKAVIEWLEAASALLPPPVAAPSEAPAGGRAGNVQVYFSPEDECVAAIRQFLIGAQHTLDLCVFTVADDRLTDAILTAHQRGVRVRLLTDDEKLFDRGSDVRQLREAGVLVRTDQSTNHMHHKFAVADNRAVLTGSYNWTRSAAEFNLENFLISADPFIVDQYAAEFTRLWEQMHPFEG
ncbi:phospholipase D-like domain-containing protein [Hymenobacter pini]|uniref:phospholipase D-like domain-containing protein n=1 Tax=Hymenobacter pini TaxID=2880879 RepID=UPI001CF31343|nr:phospholipase D-like domain-containing protein [Hymenobacter pini]MCA8833197.1 phospholipase D-like domain-containing protein [Hymenobacter pini]